MKLWIVRGLLLATAIALVAQQTKTPPTPAQGINNNLNGVNKRLLDMAKDFPADKYDFRPKPEVRTFGEVILHVTAANIYASKVAHGVADADWGKEEAAVDAQKIHGKDKIVAAFQKSADDAKAAVAALPAESFQKTLSPYLSVIEHSGEHYGQLVVYYRLNGMVPPASRPQPK
jgi:uncharacterized damage-inducible protein DinB